MEANHGQYIIKNKMQDPSQIINVLRRIQELYWKDRITNDEILRRLHGVLEMARKRHKE